nr:hypothetical protein [Streptomyces tsukubensis NRRL18488]
MGHGNDAPPRIATRVAIGGQLFKVYPSGSQSGFLTQLAVGGVQDLLSGVIEESTGQREPALKRIFAALHEQNAHSPPAQRQDHQIDRQQHWRG